MQKAGVPVVPGTDQSIDSIEEATMIAEQLGYPLMLKASAGGGGIGMQLVHNQDDLIKVFDTTKQTASSFSMMVPYFLKNLFPNRDISKYK